jgi:hypothetical protein
MGEHRRPAAQTGPRLGAREPARHQGARAPRRRPLTLSASGAHGSSRLSPDAPTTSATRDPPS